MKLRPEACLGLPATEPAPSPSRACPARTPARGVLTRHLEQVLGGARIRSLEIQRLDLVNDTTQVDMRIQLPRGSQGARTAPAAAPTDPAKE